MDSGKEPSYTIYGSQLEELHEDDLWARKPVPIEDQIATDKQGRRRFHGAFTGGFSAGYFNSVGSEEGWKPSTFTSSRAEKASKTQQRPEDFMDDEDQEVFGIAPKVLRARQEYKKTSTQQPASVGLMDSLLKPVRDTVGVVLLKSMGWKPGQGVGPRQTAREKNERKKMLKRTQKVYGCSMGPEPDEKEETESSGGSDDENITFAPDDLPSFPVAPKTNTFGMGYVGLNKNSQLLTAGRFSLFEEPETVMNAKKTGIPIRGQAFGVGAFEKEDDDIYTTEDINRYDFFLESAGESKKRRLQEKKDQMEKKKKHDKARCLENFMASTQPMGTVSFYPPPEVPKHFIPKHGARQTRFSEKMEVVPHRPSQRKGRHDLTAQERSILVGETGERRVAESVAPPKPIPVLDFEVVPTELKSGQFNPFSNNPEKLKRYQQYLTLRKMKQPEKIICLQPLVMTEWEKRREKEEFEQAAVLYQPLSEMISDRFVSSSTLIGSEETPKMDHEKPVEESVKAAKLKLFGKMTRTTETWHPCSLLCKRFNVPEPHSGLAPTNTRKKPNFSVFDFLAAQTPKVDDDVKIPEVAKKVPVKAPIQLGITPSQVPVEISAPPQLVAVAGPSTSKELLVLKAPEVFTTEKMSVEDKMDLFKSVFLSSSEDENEEEDKPAQPSREPTPPPRRPRSPPTGVFKSLDLMAPRKPLAPPVPVPVKPPPQKVPDLNPNLYGPSLPPPAFPSSSSTSDSGNTSNSRVIEKVVDLGGVWVEKSSDKHHKRSKSKRKRSRSSSKERSSKKKKSKKRKYNSDSDDYKSDKKKHKKHKH